MTDETASLILKVDSTQAAAGAEALDKLTASATKTTPAVASLEKAFAKSKDPITNFAKYFADADAQQQNYPKSANRVVDSLANQLVKLNSTGKEWAQLQAIQKAGVAVDSEAAKNISGMAGALYDLEQKQQKGTLAHRAFQAATSGVSGQLVALSAGAGPVGVFLSALGPWGMAAAVGLGAVGAAFRYVEEESARMGQKARDVEKFKNVTGLTVAEIGALRRAGAEAGITGDQVATSFERLTFGLNAAHRASGALYDDVQQVDAGLARQLQQSTTTADGINILAKAYAQAETAVQKAAIARAIFNRGGESHGPVLGKIADAGGIQNLAAATRQLNDATGEQNKRWAEMTSKIEELEGRAKNILASIFTEQGLQASLAAAQYMERMARAAKDFAAQREGLSGAQKFFSDMAAGSDAAQGLDPGVLRDITALFAARQRLSQGNGSGLGVDAKDLESWLQLTDNMRGVKTPAEQAADSMGRVAVSFRNLQDAAAADAKNQHNLVSFLGSAATISDRLSTRLKDIQSLYKDNKTGGMNSAEADSLRTRAVAGAQLDALTQKESLRMGLLGTLATVQDAVTQKQHEINKANQQGADITRVQTAAILRLTEVQAESAKLTRGGQFGIFDQSRNTANARLELQTLIDDKTIKNAQDYASAWTVAQKNIKNAGESAAIARSQFEQLTRYSLDGMNAYKQLDQLGVSSLNNFENGLVSIVDGTKSAKQAFGDMTIAILTDIERMIIRMTVAQALSYALGGVGSAPVGMTSVAGAAGVIGANGPFITPTFHTGYGPGDALPAGRMVSPAVFDNAPRFHSGIGPGERAAILRDDESVLTPGQMNQLSPSGKGGVTINYAPNIALPSNADAVTVKQLTAVLAGAQRDFEAKIIPKVRDAAQRGQL